MGTVKVLEMMSVVVGMTKMVEVMSVVGSMKVVETMNVVEMKSVVEMDEYGRISKVVGTISGVEISMVGMTKAVGTISVVGTDKHGGDEEGGRGYKQGEDR